MQAHGENCFCIMNSVYLGSCECFSWSVIAPSLSLSREGGIRWPGVPCKGGWRQENGDEEGEEVVVRGRWSNMGCQGGKTAVTL